MTRNQIVTLQYDRFLEERETEKAYCFVFGDELKFLSKTYVEDIRETSKEVDIPYWLAELSETEGFIT
jgi:hypothetical protein